LLTSFNLPFQVITSLGRVYAILSNAVVMQAAIGTSTSFPAGFSRFWDQVEAEVSDTDTPLVYSTVNTTDLVRQDFDSNGEVSWGSLQAINDAVPSYIPQVGFGPDAEF
jgi:hypothetical protein